MTTTVKSTPTRTWKLAFLKAAGFGVGVTVVIVSAAALLFWYATRPARTAPWNREAIVASYTDMFIRVPRIDPTTPRLNRLSRSVTFNFRYTLENRTERDYELPSAGHLYRVLSEKKGLEHDRTLKWAEGTFIPAGQKVNIGIQVTYEYKFTGPPELDPKFTEFTKRRLDEIDGFVALDTVNRYEIRFPEQPAIAR